MKTYLECIPCIINQGIQTSKRLKASDEVREQTIREILKYLLSVKYDESPPALAKGTYRIINKILKNEDPYKELKTYYNKKILEIENDLSNKIKLAKDSFNEAIKLAITGNIIDFGVKHDFDEKIIFQSIKEIEEKKMAIDDSKNLYEKLQNSESLLYIGDNCGEIVFDKVFIKYILEIFPNLQIYFGVRGEPIINDITEKDAIEVGIDKITKVISNGDSAPGTIIESTSEEFREIFYKSDLIIAKGQGNYETLSNIDRDFVYMLFMAKCIVVSEELGIPKMSLICLRNIAEGV